MIRTVYYLLCAGVLLFSTACTHYYYAPNTLQTPFLQKRGDMRVSAGYIAGDEFQGLELHAVLSPVRYGAVMVNYLDVRNSGNNFSSNNDWGKGQLIEIGLGGYYPATDKLSLSLFAGWGGGSVLNAYDQDARADLRFQRRFLQPGLAVQGRWVRFGAALRLNQLQYVRGDINYAIGEPHITTITRIEQQSPHFVPESAFTLGVGTRPFWVNMTLNTNHKADRTDLGFAEATFGIALFCELDYFWREQTSGAASKSE
ncbi:MAG: hypothetical protein EP344_01410 [Bacteroidetes bacterium]|nr:MAG: hypothetical protein EP344_01410 [Bacteroidota bacterium]